MHVKRVRISFIKEYLTWTVKHSQNNLAFFKHMIKNDKYRAKTAQLVAQKTWIDSSTDASSLTRCFQALCGTHTRSNTMTPSLPTRHVLRSVRLCSTLLASFSMNVNSPSLHESAPRLSRKGGPLSLMFRKRWRMDLSPTRPLQNVKPQAG